MDFGLVSGSVIASSDPETKQSKFYGSGSLTTERSEITSSEDDWRSSKKAMFLCDNQPMLSFSSPKSDALPYQRNTGYNSGNLNGANMHGFIAGVRGPFTPSQWMELEHQALIYKYINANVPIPYNLLIPIKRALDSALFTTYSGIAFRPNALGWGSYHMGYSNTDPEPGRCRRTDGKKWRCARDAVLDQKYCERHINRGRHRSRKPVEGQSDHSVAGTITTTAAASKLMSNNTSSTMTHQNQAAAQMKRNYPNNAHLCEPTLDTPVLSLLSSKENSFGIPKQPMSSYEESSQSGFGLVSSDCLLNPSQKRCTFMNSNSSKNQETHPLRHFVDDWPKNQTSETQLSVSIPITPSDFMSSTSSPTNHSPLRVSREHAPIEMGLGVGNVSNWVPISWESSAGGPLGEVLHNTANSNKAECDINNDNSSALNLMTESWESNSHSPRVGSSPTGVLQKMTFGSLSNSSAGSSPRTENNRGYEGYSCFSDPLGSTLNI